MTRGARRTRRSRAGGRESVPTPAAPSTKSRRRDASSDIKRAAQRWADTWRRAWERHDVEAIVALYAPTAVYSTQPFREAYRGRRGAREYVSQTFAAEEHVEAWFGRPIVAGDRASVAWWACTVEQGRAVTLAGTSTLRFDEDGLVLEEWDTWNQVEGGIPPDPDWGP